MIDYRLLRKIILTISLATLMACVITCRSRKSEEYLFGDHIFASQAREAVSGTFDVIQERRAHGGVTVRDVKELMELALSQGVSRSAFSSALRDGPIRMNPNLDVWLTWEKQPAGTVYCVSPTAYELKGHQTPMFVGVDNGLQIVLIKEADLPEWANHAITIE